MSASPQFEIILVELWHCDEGHLKSLDAFQMLHADMVKYRDQTMAQLCERLAGIKPSLGVKRITYRDEDGDSCTLTSDTLADALAFVVPAGGPLAVNGRLQLHVTFNENQVQAQPTSADIQHSLENAFLLELNSLGNGLDLRRFVPKLAVAALQVVEVMQEPALFQFVELLVDFREGKLTAADLPKLVPKTLAAINELPSEIQSKALEMLRNEAAKAVESQRVEEKAVHCNGVEVHCGVTCDECNKSPIIGARYKSLEREDYDLCDMCYSRPERMPEQFVRVKSSVFGDVVSSYYAPVAEHGLPVHNGVECDGCQMCPLVGRRFTKVGHDYDLCGACYESRAEQGHWQEVTITPDSHMVPLSTAPEEKTSTVNDHIHDSEDTRADVNTDVDAHMDACDGVKAMLSTPGIAMAALRNLPDVLDDEVCADLMTSLLTHSNESVRLAVQTALQQASGSQPALAQEPCADVAETPALQVAELDDSCSTSAPANSSSFDRLGLMLTQVPMEVPMQVPMQSPESLGERNEDAHLVPPADDMKTDVVVNDESEDVAMEGPEQVIDNTEHTPNATTVTRIDAAEDWLLL